MFCPNCGYSVPEGSLFCPNCGTRLVMTPEPAKPHDSGSAPIEIIPIQVNSDGSLEHAGEDDTVTQAAPRPIDYTQVIPASDVRPQQSRPSAAAQVPPAPVEYARMQTGYANTQTTYTGTRKRSSVGLIIGIAVAVTLVVVAVIALVVPIFSKSVSRESANSVITTNTTTRDTTNHPLTHDNNTNGTTTTTSQTAAGTYYALWGYDGDVWVYTFILDEDGTGTFKLYLADNKNVTQTEVDADDYNEPIVWTQDGDEVTITNPDKSTDTLPDAPNYYTLANVGNKRVLTPTDSGYKYPSETFYEDWNSACVGIDD